jgi:DNA-binding protein YbaB
MSEVTFIIKDVGDGDSKGITFDNQIIDDDVDSLAVIFAGALADYAIKLLEGEFAELTEEKVH